MTKDNIEMQSTDFIVLLLGVVIEATFTSSPRYKRYARIRPGKDQRQNGPVLMLTGRARNLLGGILKRTPDFFA
jgi:hypothetical protein